jgi:very-short-patch-repair endonuclease
LEIPRTNVHIEGLQVAIWPTHHLIVELDGWQAHHTPDAFQHDRERDAWLTIAGYRVLRFTHRDITRRPDHVVGVLRRLGIR